MTVISYSEVNIFHTCSRRYFYQMGMGLAPISMGPAIETGVEGHTYLERFYKSLQAGKTQAASLKAMHNPDSKMTGEKLKAWMLANDYASKLDLKEGFPLMVEEKVIHKPDESILAFKDEDRGHTYYGGNEYLGLDDLYIGFTPDLVWEYKNGRVEVEDYKFVQRAWPENKIAHYRQLSLYMAFLRERGIPVSRAVLRFFNATTNKISYQIYNPSDEELNILKSEFIRAALQVKAFKDLPVAEQRELAIRTLNYNTCQYCPFAYPCKLEGQGKSASKTLATQYTESEYGYIFEP